MSLPKLLLLIIFIAVLNNATAQTTAADSANMIRTARRDAHSFRLKKANLDRFQKESSPSSSDFFKPTSANVSDPLLLNDSIYVHAFRYNAFNNTISFRSPPGPRELLTGLHGRESFYRHSYTTDAERTARRDARRFRLPKDLLIRFKAGQFPNTSDYFKPTATNSRHPELICDSAYVRAFRYESVNVALRQNLHPVGTGLLIGGVSAVGLTGIMLILISVFIPSHGVKLAS